MENLKIKLREDQRNYLLDRIMSENPVDENKIRSYVVLKEKLAKGERCDDDESLNNFVELNSIVTIKTSFGFKYGLKLVLPEESDIQNNKLSIFSSMGSAIYGHQVGDTVKWFFLNEQEYAEIIKVAKLKDRSPNSLLLI